MTLTPVGYSLPSPELLLYGVVLDGLVKSGPFHGEVCW
jgi:hypothetical protein